MVPWRCFWEGVARSVSQNSRRKRVGMPCRPLWEGVVRSVNFGLGREFGFHDMRNPQGVGDLAGFRDKHQASCMRRR